MAKTTAESRTDFLLDGGNVAAEQTGGDITTYLRGVNLIARSDGDATEYYLYNAHGDVVQRTDSTGAVTKAYTYDAFGVEKDPDSADPNPFRYCGEYYDKENGTYYLRARYYSPETGRFTQEDTHWNPANRLYGDEPQKINERTDKLGLMSYAYAPDITAVMQSGNLYAYCAGNPVMYGDRTGAFIFTIIGAVAGGISSLLAESFSATEETTWRNYLGAFVGGAVSGAITGAAADFSIATGGVGPVIAFTVVGAVAGGAGAVVDGAISGDLNISDVLFSAMWGGIFSGLGGLTSGAALKEIERLSAMSVNELVDIFQIALQTELKKGGVEITAELMAEFLWNFAAWFVEGGVEYAASLISD